MTAPGYPQRSGEWFPPGTPPLLLIHATDTPEQIRARVSLCHRVVVALLEQDATSRAESAAMRSAMTTPEWREVARAPGVAVYENSGEAR